MTIALHGIGVDAGPGIAIGRVLVLSGGRMRAEPSVAEHGDVEAEVARFRRALEQAVAEVRQIRAQIPPDTPPEILEFIDTHLLMLEDKAIAEAPEQLIRTEGCSAEWALQLRRDQLVRIFEKMDDNYLRTRRDDLDHVVDRIMSHLAGQRRTAPETLHGQVVVAEDLTPADVILFHQRGAAGLVTEFGSAMSHTAILARSLDLPAVVGAHGASRLLRAGEEVILDGRHGAVLADFPRSTLEHFRSRVLREKAHRHALQVLREAPAVTRDGHPVELLANIELPEDVPAVLAGGATGVGLYRTEFLYMNRDTLPDEEEHYQAYLAVVNGLEGRPVTIRTLDLGADKQCEHQPEPAACTNPALGLRAIRLCLKETVLFRTQIRAILRASAAGPVRLMLPMLTNLWEARHARAIIDDEIHNLRNQGTAFNEDLPVGAMIETPAAALTADQFARLFDFLSIGTNDLVQYTLAVDRADDAVAHLYDPLHPAALRLLAEVVQAARRHGRPVSICGEMAGDPRHLPVVLALGLDTLSMHPSALLSAKEQIRALHWQELQRLGRELLAAADPAAIETLVAAMARA